MQEEILEFIKANKLTPFTDVSFKTDLSLYKTKQAKAIAQKVVTKVSNFTFKQTKSLWSLFTKTTDDKTIHKRQQFFNSFSPSTKEFLSEVQHQSSTWKIPYGSVVVTEDEKTYSYLKSEQIPCQLLLSQIDLEDLHTYDIVQVINVEKYTLILEEFENTVFYKNKEDVYVERHLKTLSAHESLLHIIDKNIGYFQSLKEPLTEVLHKLLPLLNILHYKQTKIDKQDLLNKIKQINQDIEAEIKTMSLEGESILNLLTKKEYPPKLIELIDQKINESGFPKDFFTKNIPITCDEEAFTEYEKNQQKSTFLNIANQIKNNAQDIKNIPDYIRTLHSYLLLYDFLSTLTVYNQNKTLPSINTTLQITSASNLFLENPTLIDFKLDKTHQCSILTGANSGGKTTLLEHIIQIITLTQLGLSIQGNINIPLFKQVYYFAKNKGSASKGAFETLLTQMSTIKETNSLILADEIEAVTEPGVAGAIICATAEYFIKKDNYLIIATHLGEQVKDILPQKTRIDGIKAKGLDENHNLIIDHNPVMGELADSTPKLIVKALAKNNNKEYYQFLYKSLCEEQ